MVMFVSLLITFIMEMSFGFSMKKKYFLEGWTNNGSLDLCLYEMTANGEKHIWKGNATHYPVEAFLEAKIWNGKSFWDVEQDMEWVDD